MADNKPFIAARLRNPAEESTATKKPAKKVGFDIIGNLGALLALGAAGWLCYILYQDLELYKAYLGLV